MVKSRARKEKLSIYLIKSGLIDHNKIIDTDKSKEPFPINLDGVEGVLYVKKDSFNPSPPWTKLFTDNFELPDGLFGKSASVGAALIVRIDEDITALTFGTGFHLLRNQAIERDFGLRVTLNSVDPDKLRSIDKASYAHNPLNSRTQSSIELDVFDLEMDSETDILYALTGASNVELFGSYVTGRDSLTLAVDIDIPKLKNILREAIRRYRKELPPEFSWVENVKKIKDKELVEILDLELDSLLNEEEVKNIWLGEPEIIDWESQIGYSFDVLPNTPRYVVLELGDLRSYLSDKGKEVNCEVLKSQLVHINNSEYKSTKSWPAYRCLYAEISQGKDQYILRNGIWYEVNRNLVEEVDGYLASINHFNYVMPMYSFDNEAEYNSHLAESDPDIDLMDAKCIKIGGKYDKIEFCDLIRNGKELIHIKYYRGSESLSHLFYQGLVGAEAFVKDENFRVALNEKLPGRMKLSNPFGRPIASEYSIVYAIATDKNLPQELPFFSKITLKNSVNSLRAFGFDVFLAKINVDPLIKKKKKYRQANKKKIM